MTAVYALIVERLSHAKAVVPVLNINLIFMLGL